MTFAASTPRLIASAPLGLLITVALGALMQVLISPRVGGYPKDFVDPRVITFTRILQESETITRTFPDKPLQAELLTRPTPGPTGLEPGEPDGRPGRDGVTGIFGQPGVGPDLGALGSAVVTRSPQILFTGLVEYPQAMYPRTGSCEVRFDITTTGVTTNIQVASCSNRGFARAAESAVARSVYQPAQGEVGPVASAGHVAVIEFKIEE